MIAYTEYEVTGDNIPFQNLEELVLVCEDASVKELQTYYEACIVEKLYDYAKFIKNQIKKCQSK